MANNSLTVKEENVSNFKGLVNTRDMVKRMTTTLGDKDKAGQFMASMLDLYENDNGLQNCDPQKVLAECLKAASLNLPIVKSLGLTYIVPYKNVPTFIIGYKGYIQLALRSGEYKFINADCIYEGEEVARNRLTGGVDIVGTPTSHKAIGYFAYFQLLNGYEKTIYMTVQEIQAHMEKYSKSCNSPASPWKTEFDAMAKKTVLLKLFKYGPMSTEMQRAEAMDIKAAETAAQAEIAAHANREVIDVAPSPMMPPHVDEETGEIVDAELSPSAVDTVPDAPIF